MVISLNSIAQLYEQKEMGYYSQKINDSYSERFNAEPAFVKERSSALSCFQKSLDFIYFVKEFSNRTQTIKSQELYHKLGLILVYKDYY